MGSSPVQFDSVINTTASNQSMLYETTVYWNKASITTWATGRLRKTDGNEPGALPEIYLSLRSFFVGREMRNSIRLLSVLM